MNINKYKIILCDSYEKNGKCNYNNKCNFAHGKHELICLFDEECVNEICKRKHPKRDRNRSTITKKNNENNNKVNILEEKDFPPVGNNALINNKKYSKSNILFSDILKKEKNQKILNVDKENNNILNIKLKENDINKKIKDLDMSLSQINKNDWSNSIDIEKIEKEKEKLELELEEINKNIIQKINLNDNIESKYEDEVDLPKVTFTIKEIDNNNNNDEILNLLTKMINQISDFKKDIKPLINNKIKNDYIKYNFTKDLNKIKSDIDLLKDNYKDITKILT